MKKILGRTRRKMRIRKKIRGIIDKPRLVVFRSLKYIYAQLVNDETGKVLTGVSSLLPEFKKRGLKGNNKEAAKIVGNLIASRAMELGIKKVIFDRQGYCYHGRVKCMAEGAREKGLEF